MYNPQVLGFDPLKGPVEISLQAAKNIYGKLPSDYQVLSSRRRDNTHDLERSPTKALNLRLGIYLQDWFENKGGKAKKDRCIKGFIYDFFS